MAGFAVGETSMAGFSLLFRKPFTALAWGSLGVIWTGSLLWLFGGTLINAVTAFTNAAKGGGPSPTDLFEVLGGMVGFFLLLALGSGVLGAVVTSAVYRAVLEPEDSAFFYLRMGAREMRLLLLFFAQGVMMALARLMLSIPVGVLAGIGAASHASTDVTNLVVGFANLLETIVVCWLYLRFSLTGPMTFKEQRFRLFECWTLTRGHDLQLLGVGVVLALAGLALYFVLIIAAMVGVFGALGATVGGNLKSIFQNATPQSLMATFAPLIGFMLMLFLVGATVLIPVTIAPWARAYQRLTASEDLAEVFT